MNELIPLIFFDLHAAGHLRLHGHHDFLLHFSLSRERVVHHLSSNHFQVFRLFLGPRVDCGSACDPLPITSLGENVFMEPNSSAIHLMKNIC